MVPCILMIHSNLSYCLYVNVKNILHIYYLSRQVHEHSFPLAYMYYKLHSWSQFILDLTTFLLVCRCVHTNKGRSWKASDEGQWHKWASHLLYTSWKHFRSRRQDGGNITFPWSNDGKFMYNAHYMIISQKKYLNYLFPLVNSRTCFCFVIISN
jgi:hypothetical protein